MTLAEIIKKIFAQSWREQLNEWYNKPDPSNPESKPMFDPPIDFNAMSDDEIANIISGITEEVTR